MGNTQSAGPRIFSHEDSTIESAHTAAPTNLQPKFLAAPAAEPETDK